jgi:glycosyltransferase involved in cell wall biosynthesis
MRGKRHYCTRGTIYVDRALLQVKTGQNPVSVVQVNYAFDKGLTDPEQLLDRYHTLTGWSEALRRAGAGRVAVVQHFHRDSHLTRNGIEYVFRRTGIPAAVAALGPDIAHVNGLTFPRQALQLRRHLPRQTAIVVQNHQDGGPVGRAPLLRLFGRAARGAADAFLFAAEEHAAWWRRAGLIAAGQPAYCVMEASTTLRPQPRDAAQRVTGMSGSPAILWVGRLNANKDPLTVLDGFERALSSLDAATLTMIYSEDPLLGAVKERVLRSNALKDRVRLIGAVPHDRMASYYSAADLFIVGSHHEGSGYAVMEACACGTMPVVTRIPSFALLTGDGSIGALWEPGNAAHCARALVDAGRRDRIAERARIVDHFTRELSWDAVGRRAMEIYEEVLGGRG